MKSKLAKSAARTVVFQSPLLNQITTLAQKSYLSDADVIRMAVSKGLPEIASLLRGINGKDDVFISASGNVG